MLQGPKRKVGEMLRLRNLSILIVLLSLIVSVGCTKTYRNYSKTLRDYTETKRIYSFDNFDAKIVWSATYLAPDFVLAAKERINELKKLGDSPSGVFVDYLVYDKPGEFLIAVYLPKGYPAINAQTDDFWQFTLDTATGKTIPPSSIETVEVTPREQKLFPYLSRWSVFYKVKFPVEYLERPFSLALRSAGVTSFLDWK